MRFPEILPCQLNMVERFVDLVVPVKQTAPYRNSSANRTDTLLLRRSRSSSFLTGISDLMVGAFLI